MTLTERLNAAKQARALIAAVSTHAIFLSHYTQRLQEFLEFLMQEFPNDNLVAANADGTYRYYRGASEVRNTPWLSVLLANDNTEAWTMESWFTQTTLLGSGLEEFEGALVEVYEDYVVYLGASSGA